MIRVTAECDNKKIVSTRNLVENREFGCSNSSNALADKIMQAINFSEFCLNFGG